MKKFLSLFCALAIVFSASAVPQLRVKSLATKAQQAELEQLAPVSKKKQAPVAPKGVKFINAKFKKVASAEREEAKQLLAIGPQKAQKAPLASTNVKVSAASSNYFASDGDVYYVLYNEDATQAFAFDILVPEGSEDVELGVTYTIDDMLADYCLWYDPNDPYTGDNAYFISCSFLKTQDGEGFIQIAATAVDENGDEWILSYDESSVPQAPAGGTFVADAVSGEYSSYYQDIMYELDVTSENLAFYFDILLPSGETDIVPGQIYTLDDMDAPYSGIQFNKTTAIYFQSVSFVKTVAADGSYTIEADMEDENADVWHISASKAAPQVTNVDLVLDGSLKDGSYYDQVEGANADSSQYVSLIIWGELAEGPIAFDDLLYPTVRLVKDDSFVFYDITDADLTVAFVESDVVVSGSFQAANENDDLDLIAGTLTITIAGAAPKPKPEINWISLGEGVLTENFYSLFSQPEQTYAVEVFQAEDTEGLFAIPNPYDPTVSEYIIIHAENPELIYILPTELEYLNASYGNLLTASYGGYYLDAYPSYTAEELAEAMGDDTEAKWGKRHKNVISFSEDAILSGLSAYNNGSTGWFSTGGRLILELPDLEAPVILNAEEVFIGAENATFAISVEDDVDEVDDLTFTVLNGEEILLADAKTSSGKLTISGLTKSTEYHLNLIATDRSGKSSEMFALVFTTVETSDTESPVILKAEVKEVSDKWATIEVEVSDNESSAEEISFLIAINGADPVEFAAEAGIITLAGLSPETAYSLALVAVDLAGNQSEAKELEFTTLELIPIVMNIDWIQARYYANYSSDGAFDFEISFWEGNNNYVLFDTYTPTADALSGEYTTDDRIDARYSGIVYNGAKPKVVSAKESIKFIDLVEEGDFAGCGNYEASFEVLGDDGNLYIGAATLMIYTYDGSAIVPMTGEDSGEAQGIEDILSGAVSIKRIEKGVFLIEYNNKLFNAQGALIK